MASIEFRNVSKSYGGVEVIKDLSFTVEQGERLILLGPSGCGKSTMLRMLAGLESITSGEIYMNGKCVNEIPSGKRNIAMVFQNYALYPHMTVRQNIEYGLKVNKVPEKEIKERTEHELDILQLGNYTYRTPKELSGGQRQRVALARALVKKCNFLLLDEPLSNLDAKLRASSRKNLLRIHELYEQTFVYVTHDQVEAMTLGQKIALMDQGKLQMFDTPENVYDRPANVFTAQFIGAPAMNILNVGYEQGGLRIGDQFLSLHPSWNELLMKHGKKEILLGLRPEHVGGSEPEYSAKGDERPFHTGMPGDGASLRGKILEIENYGKEHCIVVGLGEKELTMMSVRKDWCIGDVVEIRIDQDKLHFFDPDTKNKIE